MISVRHLAKLLECAGTPALLGCVEDITLEPDLCLHVHVQGEKYQPNVGDCEEKILDIFRVLRDINYIRSVSSAHPWISTQEGKEFDYGYESAKTLKFLQELRTQLYSE